MNPVVLVIAAASFLVSLGTSIVYKFTTDQRKMREMKAELKVLQSKLRSGEDLKQVNKRMWEVNGEYMSESLKPTIFTLVPVLLVFVWLGSFLAYDPILPGQEFTVTAFTAYNATMTSTPELTVLSTEKHPGNTTWMVKGAEGKYTVWIEAEGEQKPAEVLITSEQKYAPPVIKFKKESKTEKIVISNSKTRPLGDNFSIFGYYPGWILTYVAFSLVFGLSLRKLMNLN